MWRRVWRVTKAAAMEYELLADQANQPADEFQKAFLPLVGAQWSQVNSSSWQYALLLPSCVRLISSPARIMGTP